MANARSNRFVMRLENNQALLTQLNAVELEAWDLLSDKPVELEAIVQEDRTYARALAKLKRLGLAIYSGFTPTDAVHVLGINSHWSTQAAELSARIWMRQMRFLYGYGKWDSDDVEAACTQVYELVTATIRRLLIEVGLNEFDLAGKSGKASGIVDTITRMVLGSHQSQGRKALFNLDFASDYPIVAVGAPAASYYRDVADSMFIGLHLPQHGDVANAFGAVMGSVIQRAQITVTQPQHGTFCLFYGDQPKVFDNLDSARQEARLIVAEVAIQKALEAGAIDPSVTLAFDDVHVQDEIDGELFLESTVIATAIGPACDWRAEPGA
jgi:N-methylhydantoinase A/oxoprolinase/acetone carboxylase beta subunit